MERMLRSAIDAFKKINSGNAPDAIFMNRVARVRMRSHPSTRGDDVAVSFDNIPIIVYDDRNNVTQPEFYLGICHWREK
jgi:hypothetical protein